VSRVALSLLLCLVIALVTVGGVYLIRAVEEPPAPAPVTVPVAVEVARVEPRAFTQELEALGTVQAVREAAVSVKIAGPLRRVSPLAELGAMVGAGALLAEVDPTPFRIEVRQRQAARSRASARVGGVEVDILRQQRLIEINREKVRLARAEQSRLADLLRRGLIAQQDVERTELAVRRAEEELARVESGLQEAEAQRTMAVAEAAVAQAELDRAEQALADTEVRAPFSGAISEKLATVGEQVVPGTVLFRLADVSRLKVLVRVPADDVALLRPGVEAVIRIDGIVAPFGGRVAHIGPRADTATRTYPVEILVNHPGRGLRPGMFAQVQMPVRAHPAAILVPRAAVTGEPSDPAVFVADVQRGVAHRRPVRIAQTIGARLLVAGGLAPGDLLIVAGQHLLRDGAAIRAVETRRLAP